MKEGEIEKVRGEMGGEWEGKVWRVRGEEMKGVGRKVDMWREMENRGKGGYGGGVREKVDE